MTDIQIKKNTDCYEIINHNDKMCLGFNTLYANKVCYKNDFLELHQLYKIIIDIYIQIKKIENNGYSLIHMENDDLIDIDGQHYLINTNKLLPITDNQIIVSNPYDKSLFLSPELKNNDKLPFRTPISNFYYSLGLWIKSKIKNYELDIFNDTKINHILKYLLKEDPNERVFIIF